VVLSVERRSHSRTSVCGCAPAIELLPERRSQLRLRALARRCDDFTRPVGTISPGPIEQH
jgi:hypothetical protein